MAEKPAQSLLNSLTMEIYGMTKAQAHEQSVCIKCKQPPAHRNELDAREYAISGICGTCFDNIFKDD